MDEPEPVVQAAAGLSHVNRAARIAVHATGAAATAGTAVGGVTAAG
jgi:hypothetical protein